MSDLNELKKHVDELISKAGKADKSDDALKFSQAALNAANAIRQSNDTK
jgi:hypothetical protein